MKKKVLIIILSILLIALVVVTLLFIYYKVNDSKADQGNNVDEIENADEQEVNLEEKYKEYSDVTTDEIGKEREFKNLKFTSSKLKVNGDSVVFIVTISNNLDEDVKLGKFNIIFKDENNNVVGTIIGYAGDVIKSGSQVTPYISADMELNDAYTLEYQEYTE